MLYMKLIASTMEVKATILCQFKRKLERLNYGPFYPNMNSSIAYVGLDKFRFTQGTMKQKEAQVKEVVFDLVT